MTTVRGKRSIEGVRFLTQAEGRELLNRRTQETLGMTAEDFIAAWNNGAFDNDPNHIEIMRLAMLIPFATIPDYPNEHGG